MKDIELNPLNQNQRKLLQIGVILMVLVFVIGYFLLMNRKTHLIGEKNNSVYLQNSKLYVFDDVYPLKQYPDKVLVHYPYLIIVEADKPLTTIYNLETKKKEKEIKDILLDYYQGNIVYNRKESYFNNQNLNQYCDSAFIRNASDILCITRQSREGLENMLIKINPNKPNLWIQVYQSKYLLTAVSVIENKIYVGEINTETKQNYLSIDKKMVPVGNIVSIIYPLKGQPHFASLSSVLNNGKESYFIIKESAVDKVNKDKIVFYEK